MLLKPLKNTVLVTCRNTHFVYLILLNYVLKAIFPKNPLYNLFFGLTVKTK